MDKSVYYSVKRKYHSILTFHDHQFFDIVQENAWELHGDQILTLSDKGYNIKLSDDKWAVRFDQSKSRYDGIIDCHPNNNCMSILTTGGYLQHRLPISIENNWFTIGCWIRIRAENALQYINSEHYDIVLCGWDDGTHHIKITVASNDLGDIDCCKITYRTDGVETVYTGTYHEINPILTPATWHYFSFQHTPEYNMIHLDGKKVLEVKNSVCRITSEMFNLKLGAYDDYCSGGLDIDEFIIVNDIFGEDSYPVYKDKRIYWIYPEMLHEEEFDNNIYIKTGSMFGLHFVQLKPTSISGNTLKFDVLGKDKILGLYINNTWMDPSRYSGTSSITLSQNSDRELINDASFTLVVIRENYANSFLMDIQTVSPTGRYFVLPDQERVDKDDFLILDGSLNVIQRDRYRVYKTAGNNGKYRVYLNNVKDTFGGSTIYVIYLSLNASGEFKDHEGLQIKFLKLQAIADPQGQVQFPPEFNYIGYSKRTLLLFVNGTYMPPESYDLTNGKVIILNDNENLKPGNNVTALLLMTNEQFKPVDDLITRINGASEWDIIIDNLKITRPTYWTAPDNNYANMYNKILWYQNNKLPASNFRVLDEFDIEFKE